MDIHNLQAFIEVADKKSFSRSAETLNLTQPAVSKRIAALEAELSARLFDRMGRTVHLTEAGRVLLPSALKINSELSRIEDEICNLGKEVKGRLSIGLTEYVGVDRRLTPVLKEFRTEYPDVVVEIHFSSPEETLCNIESGVLDLGLCSMDGQIQHDKNHSRLRNVEVWSDRLTIVADRGHPLAAYQSVSMEELAQHPSILPAKDSSIRNAIDSAMLDSGVEVSVSMETQDFQTMRSMAAIGLGWACVPESVNDGALVKLNVENLSLIHSIALVRNPDRSMSRASKAFFDSFPARIS